MEKVTESIWSNEDNVIPMAEVSHIEKLRDAYSIENGQIRIVFKHSNWNENTQCHEPSIPMQGEKAKSFLKYWCIYRSEVEGLINESYSSYIPNESLSCFFNEIQNICSEYKKQSAIVPE